MNESIKPNLENFSDQERIKIMGDIMADVAADIVQTIVTKTKEQGGLPYDALTAMASLYCYLPATCLAFAEMMVQNPEDGIEGIKALEADMRSGFESGVAQFYKLRAD